MADPKSRARVERLLRGPFRPDDLTNLFLFARDHCDGRETVSDVASFVAHHTERERGIVTRETRDWFTVVRFFMPRFANGVPISFDLGRMPPVTKDYFRIAVNRIPSNLLLKNTGLKRSKAYEMLRSLSEQLRCNDDGTWSIPNKITVSELKLLRHVSTLMTVRPAFEGSRLFSDFTATLRSNRLVTKDEIRQHHDALHSLVVLYAISVMHNCVVQIGDGTTARLKAYPDFDSKEIHVSADVPDTIPGRQTVFSTSMFIANLDPANHCHPILIENPTWDFEIELSDEKKLALLG